MGPTDLLAALPLGLALVGLYVAVRAQRRARRLALALRRSDLILALTEARLTLARERALLQSLLASAAGVSTLPRMHAETLLRGTAETERELGEARARLQHAGGDEAALETVAMQVEMLVREVEHVATEREALHRGATTPTPA